MRGTAIGQPVIVDNRPGAGGLPGIELAAKAKPDGYTIALIATSYAIGTSLHKLSFDVTTTKRAPALPDVPTLAESGVPGYKAVLWHGLIGPKGMPKPIVDRIAMEVNKSLMLKETGESLKNDGVDAAGGSPDQFGAQIKKDIETWGKVAKEAKVTAV